MLVRSCKIKSRAMEVKMELGTPPDVLAGHGISIGADAKHN